jgi:hypothetical protein
MPKQISLIVKCLKCGHSLMDYKHKLNNLPSIQTKALCQGKEGRMWLSSTYACYDQETDLDIPHEATVDFFCPHCEEKLNSEIPCKICDAKMVKFNIEIGGVVSICSRKGCKNHYVLFEDLESAMRKYHREYGV